MELLQPGRIPREYVATAVGYRETFDTLTGGPAWRPDPLAQHNLAQRLNRLPQRSQASQRLPTPLVTAGVGMLFSTVLPGGWSPGEGFGYGLLIGFAMVAVAALARESLAVPAGGRNDV
jgi:hypothetical protein